MEEQAAWYQDPFVRLAGAATVVPFLWSAAVQIANVAVFSTSLTAGQADFIGQLGMAVAAAGLTAVALRGVPRAVPWWRAIIADDPLFVLPVIPSLALVVVYAVLVLVWLFVMGGAGRMLSLQDVGWWERVLMILPVPVTAAVCEEYLWRGRILGELERRTEDPTRALLWSSGLWAVSRGALTDPVQGVWLFAAGCALGWYRIRERRLLPVIAVRGVAGVIVNAAWLAGL